MNCIEKKEFMNWIENILTQKNGISILSYPLIPKKLNISDKQKIKKLMDFYDDINLFMSSKNIGNDSYYIGYNNNIYEFGCDRNDEYNLYYVVMTNNPKKDIIYFDYILGEIKLKSNKNIDKKIEEIYDYLANITDDEKVKEDLFVAKVLEYSKKRNN